MSLMDIDLPKRGGKRRRLFILVVADRRMVKYLWRWLLALGLIADRRVVFSLWLSLCPGPDDQYPLNSGADHETRWQAAAAICQETVEPDSSSS